MLLKYFFFEENVCMSVCVPAYMYVCICLHVCVCVLLKYHRKGAYYDSFKRSH